jgi:hypothetical protein
MPHLDGLPSSWMDRPYQRIIQLPKSHKGHGHNAVSDRSLTMILQRVPASRLIVFPAKLIFQSRLKNKLTTPVRCAKSHTEAQVNPSPIFQSPPGNIKPVCSLADE